MNPNSIYPNLLELLQVLEKKKIYYTLAHHRDEAIMVTVNLPGERWEVEFLEDGSVEVEKFISNGEISSSEALQEIFNQSSNSNDFPDEVAAGGRIETYKLSV